MRNSQCVIACMYKKTEEKTPSTRIPLEYTLKTFMNRHYPQPVQPGNVVFIFMHNFCKTIFYVYTYAATVGPPGGGLTYRGGGGGSTDGSKSGSVNSLIKRFLRKR